jgi:type II secretory pathway component PulF
MPITAAVKRHPKALPAEAAAFLSAGTSKAARQSALHELSRSENTELTAIWRTCIDRFSYLAAVMLFMMAAFAFIMIKIVPEYVKIFDEFDLQLPAMTEAAVGTSLFITRYLLAPIIFSLTACMLVAAIVCICYLADVNALKWFTDRIFRGRQIADVLRILAIATEHQQPLNDVLNRLTMVYPAAWTRRRIMVAATQVEAGADWRDALRNARIITKAEQSLLKTAEQVGNLPWALRQVAQRREKLAVYRLAARLQVLYPLIIILLGAFVGFYAISLFLPIVQLVHGLAR